MTAFDRRLAREIGKAAVEHVRPKIKSYKGKPVEALQKALRARAITGGVRLEIDHFWAVYIHDGRNPFVKGSFMIWWKDPTKDPRLTNGVTPKRASSLRHLSKGQWKKALKQHREALASGAPSPVVITKRIKKRTPASPFFSNQARGGMYGFVWIANAVGEVEFKAEMFRKIKKALGVTSFVPRVPAGHSIDLGIRKEEVTITL